MPSPSPSPAVLDSYRQQKERVEQLWGLADESGDINDIKDAEEAGRDLGELARDIIGDDGPPDYQAEVAALTQLWDKAETTGSGEDYRAAEDAAFELGQSAEFLVDNLLAASVEGPAHAPSLVGH